MSATDRIEASTVRMRFMLMCKDEQIVRADDKRTLVYDNRLRPLPNSPTVLLKLDASREQMDAWWKEFLGAKFAFLALLMEQPDVDDAVARELIDASEGEWTEIHAQWRRQAPAERLVYQLRLTQGPSPDVVARTWYPDLPAFHRWAALCQQELEKELPTHGVRTSARYVEVRARGRTKALSFHEEHLASWLEARAMANVADKLRTGLEAPSLPTEETLRWIAEEASTIAYAGTAEAGELIRLPLYRAILRVSKEFVAIAREPAREADAHVRSLITIVKDEFRCQYCDFLAATDDGQELAFAASTAAAVDAERARELEDEEYRSGHGITGSLLLARHDDDAFWVGTNNLDEDERQSPAHRVAFKGPYGEVRNFWVFPIWRRDRLVGGFRVITRLESDGETLAPGGWPLYVRLQLSALANFVSDLWEFLGEGPAERVSGRLARQEATRVALIEQVGIREISAGFLDALIEHVETVASIRVEKRPVGVCIGIVSGVAALADLQEYASIDHRQLRREAPQPGQHGHDELLDWCSGRYNKVAPMHGMFAFDFDGRLLGVYDLRYRSGKAGLAAIKTLSQSDGATMLLLQRDGTVTRIYRGGELRAEYFLLERRGQWHLRIPAELYATVVERAPQFGKSLIERLFDEVLQLSYRGVGALVAIGSDLVTRLDATGFRIEASLQGMGSGDFENWAKEDGALLISETGMVEMGGCLLRVGDVKLGNTLRNQLERDQKGGRHLAAACLSARCHDALVFVVSENRGVSVFKGGDIVLWDR